MPQPTFVIVSRFHVPADSQWDPARSWSWIEGYAETAGWARVLAARASRQYRGDPDEGYDDAYCGTDVMVRGGLRNAWERLAAVVVDEDIPF
jgi:hypothetical protein